MYSFVYNNFHFVICIINKFRTQINACLFFLTYLFCYGMCEPHRHSRAAAPNKYFKRETRPHPLYTVLFGVNEPCGLYAIRFEQKTYTRTHIIQVLRARRREKKASKLYANFAFIAIICKHTHMRYTHTFLHQKHTFLLADWEMRGKTGDFCRPFVSRWSSISHRINKLIITQKRFYHAKLRFFFFQKWIFALMVLVIPGYVYAAIQFH